MELTIDELEEVVSSTRQRSDDEMFYFLNQDGGFVNKLQTRLKEELGYYDEYIEHKLIKGLLAMRDKYVYGDEPVMPNPAPTIDKQEARYWYQENKEERKEYGLAGRHAYYKHLDFNQNQAKCLQVGYELETQDVLTLVHDWINNRIKKQKNTSRTKKE